MKWITVMIMTLSLTACSLLPTNSNQAQDQAANQVVEDEKLQSMFQSFSQVERYTVTVSQPNQTETNPVYQFNGNC